MRSFGLSELILVATPAFISAQGRPQALSDIAGMPTLSMATVAKEHTWRFLDHDSEPVELVHTPRLSTDDLYTLRRMAIGGMGVACLPTLLIGDDLASGTLVRLLPSLSSRAGVVHAVFPSRRGMVPAVRALLDSLSEAFAGHPLLVEDA
jgi:DNA-binding transcriptional LysR family regulator